MCVKAAITRLISWATVIPLVIPASTKIGTQLERCTGDQREGCITMSNNEAIDSVSYLIIIAIQADNNPIVNKTNYAKTSAFAS